MDTRHLLAPAYRQAAAVIPAFDLDKQSYAEIREGLIKAYEQVYGSPDAIPKEEITIFFSGSETVRALLYKPEGRFVRGAVLHVHGGGWIGGSADMFAGFCAGLAGSHGVVVLSVDYRLVPEAAGDAALADCWAAFVWFREHSERLGFDAGRLAVLGDSAGGNLCAGLALRARDADVPLRYQVLLYPAIDDRTGTAGAPAENVFAGEFVLTPKYIRQLWSERLQNVAPDSLPYLAPARIADVSGVAPAYIVVGSLDVLVDEVITYAGRLIRSGVPTELRVIDGVFHGFDLVPGPETDAFKADLARVIEKFLS